MFHGLHICVCSFSSSIEEARGVNRRQLLLHTAVAVPAFAVPNALALSGDFLIFFFVYLKINVVF